MKRLLLTLFLSVIVLGSAFAQLRWGTYTATTQNGQTLKATNTANKDTLLLDFKTISATPVCAWAPAKFAANLGKDSVYKKTLQTQRGIQVKGFMNKTTTTAIEDGSFRCNNAGGNGNPGRIASIDSLKKYLIASVKTGTLNGSTSDSLTRPAACFFDMGAGEVAFGMYPGRVKVIEYLYRFDYTAKACPDDITFDMSTYDAGNTSKTATYTMAVYKSSISTANLIGDTVNVYTTGQGLKNVHLAQEIGVTPADLSNKSLYIVIRTHGTANDLGVVDGVPNPVDASNIPTLVDPTIVFDNFVLIYSASSWSQPTGAVANVVFNHNDGSPVLTDATDFSGGTADIISADINSPVRMYFTSVDRIGTIAITEANDGGAHGTGFSFAATGAVKKKSAAGPYNIDVTYSYTVDPVTSKFTLTVPAPSSGSITDTLEITLLANIPLGATRTERLELTNGIRIWYNVGVTGDLGTGLNGQKAGTVFFGNNNRIMGTNVIENVNIFSANGQLIRTAKAEELNAGIPMNTGLYIVKSGTEVQKVLVK